MPIIQPQPFMDFWQWLDANGDEFARMAGVSQQLQIRAALREIAKATGSDWDVMTRIMVTISANRLLPLFARNPLCFSDIAQIALRHTEAAFYALNAVALSELLKRNPESAKKLFLEVIDAVSKSALPAAVDSALFSLYNDDMAAFSVERPASLVSAFDRIVEISGRFSQYLFSAISDKNISQLFARDPGIILGAYSEVAEVSNREAAGIFILALRKDRFFKIFEANPEKVVRSFADPAKACGKNSAAVFYLLKNQKIAYMLEMNPERLIISINAFVDTAGNGAEAAIPFVFDERVEERFIDDAAELGESFNSVVTAAGGGASRAITLLGKGELLNKFLENPEYVNSLLSSVVKVSGKYADAAFDLLANPHLIAMLENDPDGLLNRLSVLCASCGEATPIVFGFLGHEKVAERFEQEPDKIVNFFDAIATAGKRRRDAFDIFSNPRFIKGFEEWPEEVRENLREIADKAGPFAGDVFALLSRDRLATAITELVSGKHLAICLANLVSSSGADTPMVLQLFDSDEFTKQFINDPYKEEQIVSHLRSFTGKDLAVGLEVLSDPEVAPVFAADPSVLVTTRFRAYVNKATEMQDVSISDALTAILEDKKLKKLFIDFVRQEFYGEGNTGTLENELMPTLKAYIERAQRLGNRARAMDGN